MHKFAPIVFFDISYSNRATTSRSGNVETVFVSRSGKDFLIRKQLPNWDKVPNWFKNELES